MDLIEMDLIGHLRRQFAYDAWANREVLAASNGTRPNARPLQLLAHILSAERLWLERIRRQPQTLPVWPKFSFHQCEAQILELTQLWHDYFSQLSCSALSEDVGYRNTKGEPWNNTVQDILTHVLLHSAYHRGQIAVEMRSGGNPPPIRISSTPYTRV